MNNNRLNKRGRSHPRAVPRRVCGHRLLLRRRSRPDCPAGGGPCRGQRAGGRSHVPWGNLTDATTGRGTAVEVGAKSHQQQHVPRQGLGRMALGSWALRPQAHPPVQSREKRETSPSRGTRCRFLVCPPRSCPGHRESPRHGHGSGGQRRRADRASRAALRASWSTGAWASTEGMGRRLVSALGPWP